MIANDTPAQGAEAQGLWLCGLCLSMALFDNHTRSPRLPPTLARLPCLSACFTLVVTGSALNVGIVELIRLAVISCVKASAFSLIRRKGPRSVAFIISTIARLSG